MPVAKGRLSYGPPNRWGKEEGQEEKVCPEELESLGRASHGEELPLHMVFKATRTALTRAARQQWGRETAPHLGGETGVQRQKVGPCTRQARGKDRGRNSCKDE